MRLSGTKTSTISTSRGLGNQLYDLAGERPSLDLQFSDQKSLVDAATGSQPVTFTRASSGTYVDSQGVIRTATTNLLVRSEEFTLSPWTLFGTASRAADVTTAPNGTLTADSVTLPASSGIFSSTAAAANTTYTFSIWIRCDSTQSVRILINTNLSDPTTKTVTATTAWQRFDVTKTTSVGTTSWSAQVDTGGGNTFYLWGAQLEQSSTVGEYIPTTSTINSAPRFDHNPTTGESLGLLVEEQRTNLRSYSESILSSNGFAISSITLTSSNVATPTGAASGASLLILDSGAGTGDTNAGSTNLGSGLLLTSGVVYTSSIFVKSAGGTVLRLRNNAAGGTHDYLLSGAGTPPATTSELQGATIQSLPGGWYRCSWTYTAKATAPGSRGDYWAIKTNVNDGASGIYLWGAQLEAGSFPTSYIPTTTAAVTRSADVASISGSNFSSWYRQDEGTVFAETQLQSAAARTVAGFDVNDNSINNRIVFRALTSSVADQVVIRSGGATVFSQANVLPAPSTASRKTSVGYKVNDFMYTALGTTGYTGTSGAVPVSVTQMLIGYEQGSTGYLGGTIRRLTYWPQRLPNTTLQQITQ